MNKLKIRFFQNGDHWILQNNVNAATEKEWRLEYELTDCKTCGDNDCPHRLKESRYPVDAGGGLQCLRLAQHKNPFTWRNPNGQVISIDESVVKKIRGS